MAKTEILCTRLYFMVRLSLKFVHFKDRKAIANDSKKIYLAPSEEVAVDELKTFSAKWDAHYPMIFRSWKSG